MTIFVAVVTKYKSKGHAFTKDEYYIDDYFVDSFDFQDTFQSMESKPIDFLFREDSFPKEDMEITTVIYFFE